MDMNRQYVDMNRSFATSSFLFLVNSPAPLDCMLCTRCWLLLGGNREDVVLIGNKRYAFLLLSYFFLALEDQQKGVREYVESKVDIFALLCTDG